ncbi:MAG TPA: molybdopterin-dependent oxidoreductase [Candidatus Limnocylindria bacterium]|nr:molybdopterin-dependent oxidoreductase [Candidatus Limnocylindria bacterium]
MSAAALDRLLALLVAAQLATGLLSLRAGSPPTAPLFVAHGVLGGALLAAIGVKLYRSVPKALAARRWGALAVALLLGLAAAVALAGGFVWVASGRILQVGPWTLLTLHVIAALALAPIAVIHLAPRRWRVIPLPRRRPGAPLVSRRTALGTLTLAGIGVVTWAAANALETLAGGMRRFTGSRWLPDGGIPPPTTFFGEATDPIDQAGWRLEVRGAVHNPLSLTLDNLAALGAADERDAVLDCTSGWALRTDWRGVRLGAVLDAAGVTGRAPQVTVRSVTGWYARMPLAEARDALLATSVAGRPLPHGNGAPCRLVAPNRRGLEWVKWVTEVEVG